MKMFVPLKVKATPDGGGNLLTKGVFFSALAFLSFLLLQQST